MHSKMFNFIFLNNEIHFKLTLLSEAFYKNNAKCYKTPALVVIYLNQIWC